MAEKRFVRGLLVSSFFRPAEKSFSKSWGCWCIDIPQRVSEAKSPRNANQYIPVLFALLLSPAVFAAVPLPADLRTPAIGEHALRILSPSLLELFLVNTKQPDPARVTIWDWVNDQRTFGLPALSRLKVLVNGQSYEVSAIGFKRRPLYAPLVTWDLRIGNQLYLQLGNPIPEGA